MLACCSTLTLPTMEGRPSMSCRGQPTSLSVPVPSCVVLDAGGAHTRLSAKGATSQECSYAEADEPRDDWPRCAQDSSNPPAAGPRDGIFSYLDVGHHTGALPEPVHCRTHCLSEEQRCSTDVGSWCLKTADASCCTQACRSSPTAELTSGRRRPRAHPQSAGPWSRAAGRHAGVRGRLHDGSAQHAVCAGLLFV